MLLTFSVSSSTARASSRILSARLVDVLPSAVRANQRPSHNKAGQYDLASKPSKRSVHVDIPDRLHRLRHSPATHACTPLHTIVQEASPPSGCLATSPVAGCGDDVVPDQLGGRREPLDDPRRADSAHESRFYKVQSGAVAPPPKELWTVLALTCTAVVEMSTKIAKRQLREMSAMAAAHAGTGTPGKGVLASKSKGVYAPVSSSVSTVCFLFETSMHARRIEAPGRLILSQSATTIGAH
jgi:hypothetical protein